MSRADMNSTMLPRASPTSCPSRQPCARSTIPPRSASADAEPPGPATSLCIAHPVLSHACNLHRDTRSPHADRPRLQVWTGARASPHRAGQGYRRCASIPRRGRRHHCCSRRQRRGCILRARLWMQWFLACHSSRSRHSVPPELTVHATIATNRGWPLPRLVRSDMGPFLQE